MINRPNPGCTLNGIYSQVRGLVNTALQPGFDLTSTVKIATQGPPRVTGRDPTEHNTVVCCCLRSADARTLVFRRTRTALDTIFAVSNAVAWNSLLAVRRVASLTVEMFARHLKVYLSSYLD